jgi:putative ABC transport system permease protein
MFERDRWQEIFDALAKNKTRTFLTAFGVFWGIFMLIVMLGAGRGLRNGAFQFVGDFATNSLFIWTKPTTLPYKGFNKDRRWNFENEDTRAILDNIPEVAVAAPRVVSPSGNVQMVRGKYTGAFQIFGDYPTYFKIDPVEMISGRMINDKDIEEVRKVVVLGQRVKELLFQTDDAIDQYVQVQGVYFQVVGVYKSEHTGGWGRSQDESVTMPFTTLQKTYNLGDIVFWYGINVKPNYSVSSVEPKIRSLLAARHKVSPDDKDAFGSQNIEVLFNQMNGIFVGINLLTWFVGTLTLIAGVIGISNIMLVIIKERTKEIGIQRAIGAAPVKIIVQIIMESVFLTFVAGLIGMVFGVLIIELLDFVFKQMPPESRYILNPIINPNTAIEALILLVLSGTFAGLIPARRAIKIKPIDALRTEI